MSSKADSKGPADPFCVVDRGGQPEREEAILLDRVSGSYYASITSWFFDRVFAHATPRSILEVGCGTGHLLHDACTRAGASLQRGVGVDRSDYLATNAARRFPQYEIQAADGRELPFAAGSFDLAYIATVLVHADDPGRIVKEMARVVKPGGLVAILDQDFESAILHPGDKALTRRVLNAATDVWHDGWIGRKLPGMLRAAGLAITEVEAKVRIDLEYDQPFFRRIRDWVVERGFPAGDADRWLAELTAGAAQGELFFSRNFYCAIGARPGS